MEKEKVDLWNGAIIDVKDKTKEQILSLFNHLNTIDHYTKIDKLCIGDITDAKFIYAGPVMGREVSYHINKEIAENTIDLIELSDNEWEYVNV